MIYKTSDGSFEYYGTNAERLASFTAPLPEGLMFRESDTGDNYKVIFSNWVKVSTATGGGASTFDALTDTPANKSGQANKLVAVNSGETALEYIDLPTHDIITTHTASGLTAGHVLQALTPTTFGFGAITESMISDLDHTDPDAIHVNVGGEINGITEKATPVSGDWLVIEDSDDSNNKKKIQIGNIPLPIHDIVGGFHTVTGDVFDVVGLTATNTLGLLTPSSDAVPEALVRYDSNGSFSVDYIAIGSAARLNSTGLATGFDYSGTSATTPYAASLIATLSPSSAPSYSAAYGWYSNILNVSTQTIGNVYAISAKVEQVLAGSITNAYGLRVDSFDDGSGSIGTAYGVKVENQTAAGTNYGIHTGSGLVSLGDNLEFRQASTISTTTGALTINATGANVQVITAAGFYSLPKAGFGTAPSDNYPFRVYYTQAHTSGTLYGELHQLNWNGTGVTSAVMFGEEHRFSHLSTGTLSSAIGSLYSIYLINASGVLTSGKTLQISNHIVGSMTSLYGLLIGDFSGGGTITTQYGIYMNSLINGGTNYAIYTNVGLNRFGDKVGIGISPTYQLNVAETTTDNTSGNKYLQRNVYTVNPSGTFIGSYYAAGFNTTFTSSGTATGGIGGIYIDLGKSGGGILSVGYGINIAPISIAASINYGIFIGNITGGSGNYSIFTGVGDIRLMNSSTDKIGFHGSTPVAKQTVSGSRGGNAALASLLTALANLGLITNSTTA